MVLEHEGLLSLRMELLPLILSGYSQEVLKCKMAFQCLRIASNLMAVIEKLPIL